MRYQAVLVGGVDESGDPHCDECHSNQAGEIVETAKTLGGLVSKLGRLYADLSVEYDRNERPVRAHSPALHNGDDYGYGAYIDLDAVE